ncbi:2,5-diamino-6-(ribosylamino)-4(3H)-pyrimidinone 5'-phosphate reductase [Methanonatronarchaeum sp. AMET6-2]|uniref:2,5-diamino-6-(ribosylamino)-4(3H)-pyrimidinone 5'-phosphate reductase n=1 Tax=Methanonatronarchaeum sp. AMET6-2 TaxID=2933293 RepID=UPI001200365A|nr:2,5-diamino-6-(ribosylamino)-4(3H)-pyrimidinone 5'-phosphate reductase [Methanonatronarchaeum sp. AMET6-2]RZN60847.1 MAG: 2,5-diamino-6-(ribosylamino)-4(3H)-pyrimidinone 5'-phosphate reductase [Methanonatronarchaeia archaeon]UOY09545.1 2,5-diamino-6-(ribosylamino)-4(3H)-pyrimidinone 5'-phosphate reductase [Methanonatronarchaeum sp. AMET6-2]
MKRPYVIINSAMSCDGKISTKERRQIAISCEEDFRRVDELRSRVDGILVGIGTVLADDPKLLEEDTYRVVVDSRGRTPLDSEVFIGDSPTLIGVSDVAPESRVRELRERAVVVEVGSDRVDLSRLLEELWERGVEELLVEGGGTINWSLLSMGLVDELITYVGNMVFGGQRAPTLADGRGASGLDDAVKLSLDDHYRLGEGVVLKWNVINDGVD